MQQLWLVTVPNRGESPDSTFSALQRQAPSCKLHRFEIPSLVVGTLDSLMALSDDLNKINNQVETVVRKIERQYEEVAGKDADALRAANEVTVENFLRNFQWDYARYRYQGRQLPDLVSQVQSMVAKVDDELKKLSVSYNEKTQNLSAVQRKKTTNLITSDLEDFLPADITSRFEFVNSEYLLTVLVVVSNQAEPEFLRSYDSLGGDIAAFGGPDWAASFNPTNLGKDDGNFGPEGNRGRVKGSPVVPGSAVKIHTEGDVHLYSVTVLKGHYEAGYFEGSEFVQGKFVDYLDDIKSAFREKRYTIREFNFDPSKAGGVDGQIDQAKWEVQQTLTTIVRWCRAHYGEVFSGWIHLKVVKGFVESVLRYGLPVDFLSVFVEPNMKKEKQQMAALTTAVGKLRSELAVKSSDFEDDMKGDGYEDTDSLPFVCHKFNTTG
mmetsp:Transcript_14575/g.21967  ORF Transcript_14575/g.21967 Transcript_14575/m.21967 type:complete len:436 (+) Transcript_14575:82-1389(+)